MRAIEVTKPGELRIVDREPPREPQAGHVVVGIRAMESADRISISFTDRILSPRIPGLSGTKPPERFSPSRPT